MTSYGYIIMVIVDSCMIWFQFDCIMQLKNHSLLLLMFVAEKMLLLLVISLTVQYLDNKNAKIHSWGSTWQYANIGLENGLVLNRRQQAITWTNGGLVYIRIYASVD